MFEYSEKRDIWLFENDYSQYHESDEGQSILKLIDNDDEDALIRADGVNYNDLKQAFENYWDARNGDGLHYNGELKTLRELAELRGE